MPKVVPVKFKTSSKAYYFDPLDIEFREGDGIIVETARGVEYGVATGGNMIVPDDKIVPPLRPVIRKATEEDKETYKKLLSLGREAMKKSADKVLEFNPNMKLVDVEYTFDESKIIFYFTAQGREDFRELVRCLAGMFRKRIEMRQIDERDDIKIKGGFGVCGRECCCTCFAGSRKASIKMAKNQNLSLNPAKISGLCGKLMCCLKYENDYYAEMVKIIPKNGTEVITPVGNGKVEGSDILKQTVKVKFETSEGTEVKSFKLAELKRLDGTQIVVPEGNSQENDENDEEE